MTWFNNLKLAYKLGFSFGLCLLLALVSGAVAVTKMTDMNTNNQEMQNGPFTALETINDARNQMKQVRLGQMRAMLSADQAGKETSREIAAKAQLQVSTLLTDYERHAIQPDDKQNIAELESRWNEYQQLSDQIDRLAASSDFGASARYMSTVAYPKFTAVIDQVDKMVDYNKSAGSALTAHSKAAFLSARSLVLGLLAGALAFGILLGTFVTTTIVRVLADVNQRIDSLNTVCIANLLAAIENLAKGNLDSKIVAGTDPLEIRGHDEFGKLSESINGIIAKVRSTIGNFERAQKALKDLIEHTHKTVIDSVGQLEKNALSPLCDGISALADGDLTRKIDAHIEKMEVDEGTDLGKLAIAVNKVAARVEEALEDYNRSRESLGNLIGQASGAAEHITASAAELATGNEDLSQRTAEQASSLEETAASMEEMTGTVKQNAENARHANDVAKQAREVAQSGGVIVQNAVKAMGEVNVATKRVTDIVSVIDEIAFQTNLLALNAAVEAARVGEQGRGFAVVAAEVRSLAGRSATAAKEIKVLVEQAGEKVEDGTDLVNKSGAQLDEIVAAVNKVAEIVSEIAAASQEQSVGIEQVNKAVTQMDEITQQNAALVEEASASSQAMSQQSQELQDLVKQFKIDETHAQRAAASQHLTAQPAKRVNLPARRPGVRTGTGGMERSGSWARSANQLTVMDEF